MRKALKRYWPFYVMMLPGIVYLFINNYIPIAGLVIAFKKINYSVGVLNSPWVGFGNFEYLFKTKDAWIITRNTIGYNVAFIILGTLLAVVIAILLNDVRRIVPKKIYQTLILVPYLISTVLVSYLVYAFLATEAGFINKTILGAVGASPISWYTEPGYWPFILVIVQLWKTVGYSSIIYYATVVGIDRTYYEAAVVDGASKWQQVRFITLPSLKTTVITLTLLHVGRIFYSDFGLFYQVPMNSGMLMDVTNTIDTYVYRGLMTLNDVGRASAAGFYQSCVGFVVVLCANLVVRKLDSESALF